jgi:hypothetical protein
MSDARWNDPREYEGRDGGDDRPRVYDEGDRDDHDPRAALIQAANSPSSSGLLSHRRGASTSKPATSNGAWTCAIVNSPPPALVAVSPASQCQENLNNELC